MKNKEEIQKALIERALKEHKNIEPCKLKKSFEECFTYLPNKVLFWFNIEDKSTKVFVHESQEHLMDLTDFSINEWVVVKWKSNNELGFVVSIHPETNTLRINLNPYKFDKTTTIEKFKDVVKLSDRQKENLKVLSEEIYSLENKLSSLKEKIISWSDRSPA